MLTRNNELVLISGRVGNDPELRNTPDGTPVTEIRVAVTKTISKKTPQGDRNCPKGWKESYNKKNWEVTKWYRCTAWRGLAENIANYISKGREVTVEGTLDGEAGEHKEGVMEPRVFEDKQGNHRASYEMTIAGCRFHGNGNGNGEKTSPAAQRTPPPDAYEIDEMPF
jgi:single-strand DNA-binding protein